MNSPLMPTYPRLRRHATRDKRVRRLLAAGFSYALCVSTATATPSSVTFAVVGHIYPGVERPEILRAAIEQINERDVDAVFILGDLARGGTATEWQCLLELLEELRAPWYAVPGNHDIRTSEGSRNWSLNVGTELHGEVEINDYRFILLNSNERTAQDALRPGLDPSQRAFLVERLGQPGAYRGTFVMMHHVLWLPNSELTNRSYPPTHWHEYIAPLLKGRADAVFAGDVESYFRTEDADLELYAIGWPLTGRLIDNRLEPHEDIYLRKPFILLAQCNEQGLHVEPLAVRCDIQSDLFDTSRWKRNNPAPWSILGMKLLIRNHLETALFAVAGIFFVFGGVAATVRRRRQMPKPEESDP